MFLQQNTTPVITSYCIYTMGTIATCWWCLWLTLKINMEKAMATHSNTLGWQIPWMEEPAVHGFTKSQTWLSNFTFTFHFHSLEKKMATHSSVLAWRISGTGEPGGLLSMESHRVGHNCSDLAAAAAAGSPKFQAKFWNSLLNQATTRRALWWSDLINFLLNIKSRYINEFLM